MINECIEYSISCVDAQYGLSASVYGPDAWEDLRSEYLLYLTMAIQRYDSGKGSKLFTWIQNYLRYARLNWLKKEVPFHDHMVQSIEALHPTTQKD
jgi:DNA-directed RNA polymerase specialized sigma subunit